jgi:hypothetical protein
VHREIKKNPVGANVGRDWGSLLLGGTGITEGRGYHLRWKRRIFAISGVAPRAVAAPLRSVAGSIENNER